MDNAPFHRKKKLEALAAQASCSILWLPSYAPDLNKIENSWATIKHYARKFLARSGATLKWAILRAIATFQKKLTLVGQAISLAPPIKPL